MYYRANGHLIALGAQVGAGGEARIFRVATDSHLVAKVYHQPTPLHAAKLRAMLANPPRDPTVSQGHISIAWPRELILDSAGSPVGFLMPRIDFTRTNPLLRLYNPRDRLDKIPGFTWLYLLHAARNLASVVESLHARGHVVGDLNESNVLVSSSALVTLVDCDSIQIPASGGQFFRCTVGKPEYTPPELQKRDFSSVDRNVSHDAFGLAVLVFMLLMEGFHPFAGVWHGSGEPTLEERIRVGAWPYAPNRLISPPPYAPPFDMLPAQVRSLFARALREGRGNPAGRPGPGEWKRVCDQVEQQLKQCPLNRQHVFSRHLARCPWCDRIQQGFPDPFPPVATPRPVPAVRTASIARQPVGVPTRSSPRPPPRARAVAPSTPATPTGSTVASATRWYLRASGWAAYLVGLLLGALLGDRLGVMQPVVVQVVAHGDALVGIVPVAIALLALLAGLLGRSPQTWRSVITGYLVALGALIIAVRYADEFVGQPSPTNLAIASAGIDGAGAAVVALIAARALHRPVAARLARTGVGVLPAARIIGAVGGGGAVGAIVFLAVFGWFLATPTVVAGASAERPSFAAATPVVPTASRPAVPTTAEAVARHLVVANTGGEGVYLRHTPRLADKWIAWPDGTRLDVVGPDADGDGQHWKQVRDPDGHVGWVPAEYVVAAPVQNG